MALAGVCRSLARRPRPADIVTTARSTKAANEPANRALAEKKLDSFLRSEAIPLKEELDLLAAYILSKCPASARWVAGPLKKLGKAMSKTIDDYDYAWTLNKDLVRGTIVCKTDEELKSVNALVLQTCTDVYGMFLIKKELQRSVRDGVKPSPGTADGTSSFSSRTTMPSASRCRPTPTADLLRGVDEPLQLALRLAAKPRPD